MTGCHQQYEDDLLGIIMGFGGKIMENLQVSRG
jgi:hypothetical protein